MGLFVGMMYILIALPLMLWKLLKEGHITKSIKRQQEEAAAKRNAFLEKFSDTEKLRRLEWETYRDPDGMIARLKDIFALFPELSGLESHYKDEVTNTNLALMLIAAHDGFIYRTTITLSPNFYVKEPDGFLSARKLSQRTIDAICAYITKQYQKRGSNMVFQKDLEVFKYDYTFK